MNCRKAAREAALGRARQINSSHSANVRAYGACAAAECNLSQKRGTQFSTASLFFEVILLRRAHRAQRAVEHAHHRRGKEAHHERCSDAGCHAGDNAAEDIGVGVVAVDHAVEIHRPRVERGDDDRCHTQRADDLRAGKLKAALLGVSADHQAARGGGNDPQHGRRRQAVGDELVHKAAEQTHQQSADRPVQQCAEDDGQRVHADADPPEIQRADQAQHHVDRRKHRDHDQLARGQRRRAAHKDDRRDERGDRRDQDPPYGGGQLCDIGKHCEDLLFR